MTLSQFYNSLMSQELIKMIIPIGYTPNLPVLETINNQCVVKIPWMRYKMTGTPDKTLVFPIRFITTFTLNGFRFAGFEDLELNKAFNGFDFNKAVGVFRHEAIKNLDRNAYLKLREETLKAYEAVADSMAADAVSSVEEEENLRRLLGKILEPSLKKAYHMMSPEFHERFIAE